MHALRNSFFAFIAGFLTLASCPMWSVAQNPSPTKTGSASLTCPVRNAPPSAADTAYFHGKYDDAVDLYRKDSAIAGPEGDRAHNGLIRSLLSSGKSEDAEKDASNWAKQSPNSSWALASLDEVHIHEGSFDQAVASIQAAGHLDRCNMQVHVDFAIFNELTGMYATAKRHLDLAHTYEPTNLEINDEWLPLQPRSVKLQQITQTLDQDKSLPDDVRADYQKEKDYLEHPSQPCHLTSPLASVTIPFHGIKNGPTGGVDWGLMVGINGKERRMEIDTGASGLTLTRQAAASLHLIPEEEEHVGGIGSGKSVKAFRAKVASIKIGGLEFQNCYIEVLEKDVEAMDVEDGLIGGDVFRDFLLTLDFPGRQLKLDPLPPIPGEPADAALSLASDTQADHPVRDAYTAPSMQNWYAVFRLGHELMIPTHLNGKATHLFLLDTGADSTLITAKAAREVTKVSSGPDMGLYGVSGKVEKTYITDKLEFGFAGLRYPTNGVMAVDNQSMLSARETVNFSGILGAGILRRLTMQIDYRDDLVNFTYDPKRLVPCMPGVYREDCYD
jgi:predicted aspartyl protease